jgi:hypothetical protein
MNVNAFLLRRGIPAQPILNGYCGNYEVGMPKSMINHPAFNYENRNWINLTTTSAPITQMSSPSIVSRIFNYIVYHVPNPLCSLLSFFFK